jgi:hypothetical protein
MKIQKVASLVSVLGLAVCVAFGAVPSAGAQSGDSVKIIPRQNSVFGTFRSWKCDSGRVYIQLRLDSGETSSFPTNKTCQEVNDSDVQNLFGGQGRNTYVRNDRDQITRKAVW